MPPIDGLQDISPIVSSRWVSSSVCAPTRAAAAAASHPACPPPTTTTSKRSAIALAPCHLPAGSPYSPHVILLAASSNRASTLLWQCGAGYRGWPRVHRPASAGRDPADRGRGIGRNHGS